MPITIVKNAAQNAKLVLILLTSALHASQIQHMIQSQINVFAYLVLTGIISIYQSASHVIRAARNAVDPLINLVLSAVKMQHLMQPRRNAFAMMDSLKTITLVISAWLVIRHAKLAAAVNQIVVLLVSHMRSHALPLQEYILVPAKMDLLSTTQLGIVMPVIRTVLHVMELLRITALLAD